MANIEQIYRDNLALLIKETGTQKALADKTGKSAAQLSQWLNASVDPKTNKPRAMSRQTARQLEKTCGKPEGWMDQPHQERPIAVQKGLIFEAPNDDELELLEDIRALDDDDLDELTAEIAKRADKNRARQAKWREKFGLPAAANARRAKPKVVTSSVSVPRGGRG